MGIWRQICKVVEDMHSIQVIKVKAHNSEKDCDNDHLLLSLRKGNVAADFYAKAGITR